MDAQLFLKKTDTPWWNLLKSTFLRKKSFSVIMSIIKSRNICSYASSLPQNHALSDQKKYT